MKWYALFIALMVLWGSAHAVPMLVERPASASSASSGSAASSDWEPNSILEYAVRSGNTAIVSQIIALDPNIINSVSGVDALIAALERQDYPMIMCLLSGAPPEKEVVDAVATLFNYGPEMRVLQIALIAMQRKLVMISGNMGSSTESPMLEADDRDAVSPLVLHLGDVLDMPGVTDIHVEGLEDNVVSTTHQQLQPDTTTLREPVVMPMDVDVNVHAFKVSRSPHYKLNPPRAEHTIMTPRVSDLPRSVRAMMHHVDGKKLNQLEQLQRNRGRDDATELR